MNKGIGKRLKNLEQVTRVGMPPVLLLDGTEAPPSLWNKRVTREQAEAINMDMQKAVYMLANPVPVRRITGFEGE